MKNPKTKSSKLFKLHGDEKRLVSGVVYEPDFVDSQDEFAGAEEIEKAAHAFLVKFRTIKLQHSEIRKDVDLVESFVAPTTFSVNGQEVKKGSWN